MTTPSQALREMERTSRIETHISIHVYESLRAIVSFLCQSENRGHMIRVLLAQSRSKR